MIIEVTLFKDDKSKFVSVEVADDLITADPSTQRDALIAAGSPVIEAYRELTASE